MNAKELRIGNIIQSTEFKNPFSVDYQNIGLVLLEPDKYEPVNLTPEWLVSRGFHYDGITFWSDKMDEFNIMLGHYAGGNIYLCTMLSIIHSIEIQYVHQLQNLYFALTGEEIV